MRCLICDESIISIPDIWELFFSRRIVNQNVCDLCFSKFEKITSLKCKYCDKKGNYIENICTDCTRWKSYYGNYIKHHALFTYNTHMQSYFRSYKRNGDIELAKVFSSYLSKKNIFSKFDIVTYIPSTQKHIEIRKFNPVFELFKEVPKLQRIFEVKLDSGAQAEKSRVERLKAPQKFSLVKEIPNNSKILIVDDIYTTGRTINHCRDLLLNLNIKITIETFSLVR